MGLARRNLGHDEVLVLEVRSHRGQLVAPFLFLLLCGAGSAAISIEATALPPLGRKVIAGVVAGIGLLWFFVRWARWRGRTIVLTNERVIVVTGRLRKSLEQVRLVRLVEVHCHQSFVDRLIRRGSVVLEVDDGPSLVVGQLRKPEAFQRLILRQITPEFSERGLDESDVRAVVETRDQPGARPYQAIQIVTENDPTPPAGTPAVSGSQAATLFARFDELDRLEASGALSHEEASRRRQQLS